jgi:hypothetical protein
MSSKVVARYIDGRLLKGVTMDVDPTRPTFHVRPPGGQAMAVELNELKALFFVRTLEGNPGYREHRRLEPGDKRAHGSTIVSLRFADGEEIVGLTIRYPPNRPYFFVVPVDPASNNIRILVNRAAVVAMEAIPASPAAG